MPPPAPVSLTKRFSGVVLACTWRTKRRASPASDSVRGCLPGWQAIPAATVALREVQKACSCRFLLQTREARAEADVEDDGRRKLENLPNSDRAPIKRHEAHFKRPRRFVCHLHDRESSRSRCSRLLKGYPVSIWWKRHRGCASSDWFLKSLRQLWAVVRSAGARTARKGLSTITEYLGI